MSEQSSRLPDHVMEFLQQEVAHLQKNVRSVHFKTLVPLIERTYDAAFAAVPKPLDRERDLWSWQALGLCHRSFLVAASIIGRGHPDDAVGTTRRALEDGEDRLRDLLRSRKRARVGSLRTTHAAVEGPRTRRRQAGADQTEAEATTRPRTPEPRGEVDRDALRHAALHPEFVGNHDVEKRPGEAFLHYLTMDGAEIDRAMRTLAAVHIHILEVFNEVFGDAFRRSPECCAALQALGAAGERLTASFVTPTEATT